MDPDDQDLKCVLCRKIFQSMPITLVPCGWVVCSHHLNSDQMNCFICSNGHELVKKNCITTKPIEIKYLKFRLENSTQDLEKFGSTPNQILNRIKLRKKKVIWFVEKHFDSMTRKVLRILRKNENNHDKILFDLSDLNSDLKEHLGELKIKQGPPELLENLNNLNDEEKRKETYLRREDFIQNVKNEPEVLNDELMNFLIVRKKLL